MKIAHLCILFIIPFELFTQELPQLDTTANSKEYVLPDSLKRYDSLIKVQKDFNFELRNTNDSLQKEIKKQGKELNQLKTEYRFYRNSSFLFPIILTISILVYWLYMKKRQKKKNQKKLTLQTVKTSQTTNTSSQSGQWFIVNASVPGKSHILKQIPCQDSAFFLSLTDGWGISVCCDGAGSAEKSNIGAAFVATEAVPRFFKELIEHEGWISKKRLPDEEEWQVLATEALQKSFGALQIYADHSQTDISSLACTVIVVIHSPLGLLVTHIGDGRAGFCDENGHWQSIITPHKGEEANQTIFLTSHTWLKNRDMRMSGVLVPECRVISKKTTAFVLMSDGCEHHSFECSVFDNELQKWSDPNRPYPKFFDPLVSQIREVATQKQTNLTMNESWKQFLESGTEGLKNEQDDKTMLLGILI